MGTLQDLPGELNLVLFVGRAVTVTVNFPASIAGRTFTCSFDATGTPIAPTVTVLGSVLSFPLTAAQLPAEYTAGLLVITETTGGGTVPYIAGTVKVTRNIGAQSATATVVVNTVTALVSVNTWPTDPLYATSAARDAAIVSPTAGNTAFLTTPAQLTQYDGTGWVILSEPNQTWTPTITNLTVGNGTMVGRTHRSDGWVDIELRFTFGSTSAIAGDLSLPLPYTAAATVGTNGLAVGYLDSGTTEYPGIVSAGSTTGVNLRAVNAAGTYAVLAVLSSTVPMTWATGDVISVRGRYAMASRYS